MRRSARRPAAGSSSANPVGDVALPRSDRVDRVARHEEDAASRDRDVAQHLLRRAFGSAAAVRAVGELDAAHDLALVRRRSDDEEDAAVGADVELAVSQHRGRLLRRAHRQRPQSFAGGGVEGSERRAVVDLVETCAVHDRRRVPELDRLRRPLRRLDVAGLGAVDRGDQAQLHALEVLVAVRQEHGVAADGHAGVDRALGGGEAPHLLTGLRLDRVHGAVAQSRDQQPHAVDGGDERGRVGGVVRTSARVGDVHHVAGPLVEGDETMRAPGGRSPVGDGGADDHEIAVDDRRHRSSTVRRERRELLTEGTLPEQLALGTERDDLGAAAQRVDVAGLRIGSWRGPRDAVGRHVALKEIELVFPDDLARVGVERQHALLQLRRRGPTDSARRRGCP